MAWTRLVSSSTAGNISMNIDYNVTSVTRTSNTNVRVTYGIRFQMATTTWTSNSVAAFTPAGGTRRFAFNSGSGANHTNKNTWYYANTTGSTTTSETAPFTQDITVTITQTSASFEVGYGWDAWTPSQCGKSAITVTFPTGATAPTGCWCSVSNIQETSVSISGGYSSNGNATVTSEGYQYHSEGYGWSSYTGQALAPGVKYWFRYYATNSQGTSYSRETTATTYLYPHCTEIPHFRVGDNATAKFYNPLNRTFQIQLWSSVKQDFVTDLITVTGTTYTEFAQFADSFYRSIPNQTESYFSLDTWYSGNKDIKTGGRYYIRGDEKPTFSSSNIIDVVDVLHVDDITGNSSKIIKGHNKITGNVTKMTPLKYSNGSRYVVSASANPSSQELSYDSGNTKSFVFENLTTNSFSVTAYDSRGLSTPASKTIDLVDYNIPKVNSLSITRQNGIGEYAIISANGTFTNWTGWSEIKKYNSIQKVYMRYKPSTSDSYGEWVNITEGLNRNEEGNWNVDLTLDDVFTNTVKYDFQLYVQDLLESSAIAHNTLSTANGFLWRDLLHKWLGINKKPTCTLDVNGDVNVDGILDVQNKAILHKTSYNCTGAALIGSNQAKATTVPDLIQELIVTNGQMGSVAFSEAFVMNNITVHKIWYTYIWVPHRIGGMDGQHSTDDNSRYGTLILNGMTGNTPTITIGWYGGNITYIHSSALDSYPVNSLYLSLGTHNPEDHLGGKWKLIGQGRTLIGVDDNDADFKPVGKTGGSKTHEHWTAYFDYNQGLAVLDTSRVNKRQGWSNPPQDAGNWHFAKSGVTNVTTGGSQHGVSTEKALPPYIAVYIWQRTA